MAPGRASSGGGSPLGVAWGHLGQPWVLPGRLLYNLNVLGIDFGVILGAVFDNKSSNFHTFVFDDLAVAFFVVFGRIEVPFWFVYRSEKP